MVNKADKERIRALLSEAITVLCKNGLGYELEFSVEGLLGITVDKDEIFLVNIKENVFRGQEAEKNGHDGKTNSEYSDQALSFASTLEGVTGEFIEVGQSNNSNHHHNNNNRRPVERGKTGAVNTQNHLSARSQHMGSAIKVEQSDSRQGNNDGSSAVAASQATILAGDLVLGNAPWDQGLAASSLTVSQAVAVSAPMVAASMSQMSGIAQPTQLEEQRRRSRDHMRRYRQQLRTTNYTEYEDRKRRQREGMRRYRERLRVENPEKYAEMNRKHAEQERRRRMRVRSFSASFAQQAAAHQSLQAAMQQAGDGGGGNKMAPASTTDFLHMAMENSQLLPVRDMHQLMQTGFPLAAAGGALGLSPGALGVAPGSVAGLPPPTTASPAVAMATGGSGNPALTSLTPVSVEEVQHPQQQQQQPQHQEGTSNQQLLGSTALGREETAVSGHLQPGTPTLSTQTMAIQESQVLSAASSSSSPVVVSSSSAGGVSTLSAGESHYSQRTVGHSSGGLVHHSHADGPPLRAEASMSSAGVEPTVAGSAH